MTSTVFSVSRSCLYWQDLKYFVITVVPIVKLLVLGAWCLEVSSLASNFDNDSNSDNLSSCPCGFQKYRAFFFFFFFRDVALSLYIARWISSILDVLK